MRRLGLWLVLAACTPGTGGNSTDVDLGTSTVEDGTTNPVIQTVTSVTEATNSGATDPVTSTSTGETTTPVDTDDPTTEDGTTAPPEAVCGNGIVEGDEPCDDGNDDETDECTSMCRKPGCGDGTLQVGEECDDGNQSDNDACTNACVPNVCGDGIVFDEMEQCDDGNTDDSDACLTKCKNAKCGDGVLWAGEETCDDGFNDDEYNGCAPGCDAKASTYCGDGYVQDAYEHCDGQPDLVDVKCTSDCLYDFSAVSQMSCAKTCSWAGPEGCGQEDADVFCKLRTGSSTAKATSYKLAQPTDKAGFPCSNVNVYLDPDLRKPLGLLTEYGVNKPVLYQDSQIAFTHGTAPVIQGSSLICKP